MIWIVSIFKRESRCFCYVFLEWLSSAIFCNIIVVGFFGFQTLTSVVFDDFIFFFNVIVNFFFGIAKVRWLLRVLFGDWIYFFFFLLQLIVAGLKFIRFLKLFQIELFVVGLYILQFVFIDRSFYFHLISALDQGSQFFLW